MKVSLAVGKCCTTWTKKMCSSVVVGKDERGRKSREGERE